MISHNLVDVADIIKQYERQLPIQRAWKDTLPSGFGSILIEFLSTFVTFAGYGLESALLETNLDTSVKDKNIRSIVRSFGVVLDRRIAPSVMVSISSDVNIPEYSQFEAGPVRLYNTEEILFGERNLILHQGTVQSAQYVVQDNEYFSIVLEEDEFSIAQGHIKCVEILNINTDIEERILIPVSTNPIWRQLSTTQNESHIQEITTSSGKVILLFGNDYFGYKPHKDSVIDVTYAITNGLDGNDTTTIGKPVRSTVYNAEGIMINQLTGGTAPINADAFQLYNIPRYVQNNRAISEKDLVDYSRSIREYQISDVYFEFAKEPRLKYRNIAYTTEVTFSGQNLPQDEFEQFSTDLSNHSALRVVFLHKPFYRQHVHFDITVYVENHVVLDEARSLILEQLSENYQTRFSIYRSIQSSDIHFLIQNSFDGVIYSNIDLSGNALYSNNVHIENPVIQPRVESTTVEGDGQLPLRKHKYAVSLLTIRGETCPPEPVEWFNLTENSSAEISFFAPDVQLSEGIGYIIYSNVFPGEDTSIMRRLTVIHKGQYKIVPGELISFVNSTSANRIAISDLDPGYGEKITPELTEINVISDSDYLSDVWTTDASFSGSTNGVSFLGGNQISVKVILPEYAQNLWVEVNFDAIVSSPHTLSIVQKETLYTTNLTGTHSVHIDGIFIYNNRIEFIIEAPSVSVALDNLSVHIAASNEVVTDNGFDVIKMPTNLNRVPIVLLPTFNVTVLYEGQQREQFVVEAPDFTVDIDVDLFISAFWTVLQGNLSTLLYLPVTTQAIATVLLKANVNTTVGRIQSDISDRTIQIGGKSIGITLNTTTSASHTVHHRLSADIDIGRISIVTATGNLDIKTTVQIDVDTISIQTRAITDIIASARIDVPLTIDAIVDARTGMHLIYGSFRIIQPGNAIEISITVPRATMSVDATVTKGGTDVSITVPSVTIAANAIVTRGSSITSNIGTISITTRYVTNKAMNATASVGRAIISVDAVVDSTMVGSNMFAVTSNLTIIRPDS